jgi:hypothetical protein
MMMMMIKDLDEYFGRIEGFSFYVSLWWSIGGV